MTAKKNEVLPKVEVLHNVKALSKVHLVWFIVILYKISIKNRMLALCGHPL